MAIDSPIQIAMQETNDIFCTEVLSRRDFSALDRVYTRNACVLPPGKDIIQGRTNVIAFWRTTASELGIQSATLTTVESEAAGESVIEIGRAKLVVAGGESAIAKYVIQWRQEEGLWKWHIDIWNPIS